MIELPYLDDVKLKCDECEGKGLILEYAEISDGEQTFHEAISEPMGNVLNRINLTPKFQKIFEYFKKLNLDYLSLDRKVASLSGGEKQRIYLLSKLLKSKKNQFILLENLSFGLSDEEIPNIGHFLHELSILGHTVLLIDHHKAFTEMASYLIRIGSNGKIETIFQG